MTEVLPCTRLRPEIDQISTNAAWHADNQTAGLLSSGDSMSQTLDSGIQAVDFYSAELIQGRRVVDILRENDRSGICELT